MGLNICQICMEKDFVYRFRPNIFPYFWFCENCRKRLMIKHYRILNQYHLLYVNEIKYPEYKIKLMRERYKMAKKIKILIYE